MESSVQAAAVDSVAMEDVDIVVAWVFLCTAVCAGHWTLCMCRESRNPSLFTQRLNWEAFVATYGDRRDYKRHMRMTRTSFDKLLSFIRNDLEKDQHMAWLRGGPILPEIMLYCCIRWLAGGMYSDIYMFTGVSRSSFYRSVWVVIHAINKCVELNMKFPHTNEEAAAAAAGFRQISFRGCIDNCVAVVDGYLVEIITPSKKEAGNVRSYFSGHYQCYGVNVQAACDHLCRFVFIGVAGPGVMGDRDGIQECGLYAMIERLGCLFTVIGDCAYKATEHMAPIYAGEYRKDTKYDAYNFYASQLRIRIEMAFGMMAKKWGILNRPLGIKLKNVKHLIVAIGKLHNFCINERICDNNGGYTEPRRQDWEMTIHDQSVRAESANLEALANGLDGWSLNRERMALKIYRAGYKRPSKNSGRGCVNGLADNDIVPV